MTWAAPGVKCVCVDGNWAEHEIQRGGVYRVPMVNEVLTIACVRDNEYLVFEEIPERQEAGKIIAWSIRSFRPLVTRTQDQDLELFLPLLTDTPVPA